MASNFQKEKRTSYIEETLSRKKTISNTDHSNFKVSFQYIDTTQKFGSSYLDWQNVGLLSRMLETLTGYCTRPLKEQYDGDKFALYGDFPKKEKTLFSFPKHVPEDAEWARIHINGAAVVVGHVVGDTFYVVFLDKTHKFYLTKRVTGK